MYIAPAFAAPDDAASYAILAEYPFATLITTAPGGTAISHVPLRHERTASGYGVLRGHLARANPHAALVADAPSIAIFHGPHAYVSPRWYGTPEKSVPTWNYIAVHVTGRAQLVTDPAAVQADLAALVQTYEGAALQPWSAQQTNPGFVDALLNQIVAFVLPIERLEGKFKLSQNRPAADRVRVAAELANGSAEEQRVAEWMRGGKEGEN